MKNKYVTALIGIEPPRCEGPGIEVADGLYLTADPHFRKEHFFTETIWNQAGGLETEFFIKASCVLYRFEDTDDYGDSPIDKQAVFMHECISFLNGLWLVKDNAVNFEQAYLFSETKEGLRATSNFMNVRYHMSDGSSDTVGYSPEELTEAISYAKRAFIFDHDAQSPTKLPADKPRVSRALYWAQAARAADDVTGRVALSCTAFETMASTTATELTHQLSERIAYLLADSPTERLEIYQSVKQCYGFRSKMVHGDTVKPKHFEKLKEASKVADDYLRKLLRLILSNESVEELFDLSTEKLHERMTRLVLGEKLEDVLQATAD